MCRTPKLPEIKTIMPQQTSLPDAPPDPVEVSKAGADKVKRRTNPLRIELAKPTTGTGTVASGVNV